MQRNPTQQYFQGSNIQNQYERPRRDQHYLAKSTSVSNILNGDRQNHLSNHYIDSLQRFKKDFAASDKQQRQRQRERKMRVLEERKNQQIQRESRLVRLQYETDQRNMDKINQSRYLCEIGVKKVGYSNSMPMDPITLKYHNNQFGNQQQYNDEENRLRGYARAHHIQNASTCGYNLINGTNLHSIKSLIPENTEGRFENKVGSFYYGKRLDPNVDLGLNPKHILPKHIGQEQRAQRSPIKNHKFQQSDSIFQSSYNDHYGQTDSRFQGNSRMQQNLPKGHYDPDSYDPGHRYMQPNPNYMNYNGYEQTQADDTKQNEVEYQQNSYY